MFNLIRSLIQEKKYNLNFIRTNKVITNKQSTSLPSGNCQGFHSMSSPMASSRQSTPSSSDGSSTILQNLAQARMPSSCRSSGLAQSLLEESSVPNTIGNTKRAILHFNSSSLFYVFCFFSNFTVKYLSCRSLSCQFYAVYFMEDLTT